MQQSDKRKGRKKIKGSLHNGEEPKGNEMECFSPLLPRESTKARATAQNRSNNK